jgi:HlyD family secretion protein
MHIRFQTWLIGGIAVVAAAASLAVWQGIRGDGLPAGLTRANGRIEAVEIDIAAKTGGRLQDIMVREGDFVKTGDAIARLDTSQLGARMRQAQAELRRSKIAIDTAHSLVVQRQAERTAAEAVVEQQQAALSAANGKLARSQQLVQNNTVSQQVFDDDQTAVRKAEAALAAARASLAAADAAIGNASMQVVDAEAAVEAAKASIDSIRADIDDSTLRAPRDGRIQYRVAQPGEVVAGGGRVVNMLDFGDISMTFFLPTAEAGRLAIGAETRIVLDALPNRSIPATISFVSDVAQFTPKTVETEEERLKLMFRVRARIAPELIQKHVEQIKTGLPGTAYVRLDPAVAWPAFLTENLVR